MLVDSTCRQLGKQFKETVIQYLQLAVAGDNRIIKGNMAQSHDELTTRTTLLSFRYCEKPLLFQKVFQTPKSFRCVCRPFHTYEGHIRQK